MNYFSSFIAWAILRRNSDDITPEYQQSRTPIYSD